jgi:SagB-type dehydrogenase family enzyme
MRLSQTPSQKTHLPHESRLTSRRTVLKGLVAPLLVPSLTAAAADDTIMLPTPRKEGGLSFMEAVSLRQSTRTFGARALDQQVLSDLLWAAFGINRSESKGRTAPSWHGSVETDIYVASADGVWLYLPQDHGLRRMLAEDIRAEIGEQPYAKTAPVILIYAADKSRMYEAPDEQHVRFAYVDSAFVSQNVYLFAAAFGLKTVVIGSIKAEAVAKRLGLRREQLITLGQPIGYPV